MLLSAEQVTKSYGDRVLLDGVSFYLEQGGQGGDHRRQRRRQVHTLLRLLAGRRSRTGGRYAWIPACGWSTCHRTRCFRGSAPCWSRCCWG